MPRILPLSIILTLLALSFAGCGDDDCVECPQLDAAPPLYAVGTIAVDGSGLDILIDVFDVEATGVEVDSALVDGEFGHCCVRDGSQVSAWDGRQIIANVGNETCPSDAMAEFTPGDTTELSIYCEGQANTVRLHLLDVDDARPSNLSLRTHAEDGTVEFDWDPVEGAEWYSVKLLSYLVSSIATMWTYACVDTNTVTMDLPFGSAFTRDISLYIASATGPMPTETNPVQNISGEQIAGTIYSLSDEFHWDINLIRTTESEPAPETDVEVPSLAELMWEDGRFPF